LWLYFELQHRETLRKSGNLNLLTMKKKLLLLVLLGVLKANAQTENSDVSFVNDFQFTIGVTNVAPNKSMMGDAHKTAFPSFTGRLGIFSYKRFTLGLHA